MEFSLTEIASATEGSLLRADGLANRPLRIVTDSREATSDTIFWALQGTTHDGHSFIDAALDNGAAACVVSSTWAAEQKCNQTDSFVVVTDTLYALASLAAWNRRRWPVRVIAITGSFGKTTTREMVYAALSRKFETLRSPKNFNNEYGVPLTLLQLGSHHELAIVELGASACGEIRRLAEIAQPDTGIITGTGFAHAAQFGGQKAVVRAKGELAEAIPGRGLLLLCGDEESASSHADRAVCRVVRVGTGTGRGSVNDLVATEVVQTGERLQVRIEDSVFEVTASGRHFARAVLFAVATARDLSMNDEEIQQGLNQFLPVPGRCEVRQLPVCTIINDCYNSSPEAMQAAIAVLAGRETSGQRILVTGDMLSLGEHSSVCHREIGITAAGSGIDHILAIGRFSRDVAAGAVEAGFAPERASAHTRMEHLLERLDEIHSSGDVILVKGSRATQMERVIEWLESQSTSIQSDLQSSDQEKSLKII